MARKKRRLEPITVNEADNKPKTRYKDDFQTNVGSRVEDIAKKFEGKGKTILYGIGALLVLGAIVWFFYARNARSNAAGQAALGKAIETSQAMITDAPPPAGSTARTFKTQKERAEAAIAEFQAVADSYGGAIGEKAKYFIAVNRLTYDRAAGISELEPLAQQSDDVGKLSKFALAQAKADDGKLDEAATLYSQLAALDDPIVSKETVNFELAKIYEKQDKKADAANVLFDLVRAASDQKDLDGKPVPLSLTAEDAKAKLEQLDPEKAKQLPSATPDTSLLGPK